MSRLSRHPRFSNLPAHGDGENLREPVTDRDTASVPHFIRQPIQVFGTSGIISLGGPSRRTRGGFKPLLWFVLAACAVFVCYRLLLPRMVPSIGDTPPTNSAWRLQIDDRGTLPRTHPLGEILHQVKRGETFSQILISYGFDATGLERMREPLQEDKDFKNIFSNIRPDDLLEFVTDGSSFPLRVELPIVDRQRVFLERIEGDAYRLKLLKLQSTTRERVAVGVITSSFAAAAAKASVPYDVVDELVDVFGDRVAFEKDFQKGDRFTAIYRDTIDAKGDSTDVSVLAASLSVKGKNLMVARYIGTDGKPRYFDGEGKMLGESFLRYPLKFSRISSHFTFARFHPVLKHTRPHNGVDFAAPTGTPVRTVSRGKVEFAGSNGGSGIMIKIQHGDRFSTAYLHLSKITPGIKRGTIVERGEVIGAVGQTGLATGPHLHFSLFDRGKYVDPLKGDLPLEDSLDRGTMIPKSYLSRLVFTLQHYQTLDLNDMNWSE